MAAADNFILSESRDSVCKITLNRPDVLNAFNQKMGEDLLRAIKCAAAAAEVRAILLTGAGRGFCAGQDLAELLAAENAGTPLPFGVIVQRFNEIVSVILSAPKPVVCAVNGVAAGAGANIAVACDFVVASEKASFAQSFVRAGLIPDSGGTFFLPRIVGVAKAKELAMLGDKISAAEAQRLGLIYQVAPENTFAAEAEKLAVHLAQMPTRALSLIKELIRKSLSTTLDEQFELEKKAQVEACGTADYQEGVRAFVEKRAPKFSGR